MKLYVCQTYVGKDELYVWAVCTTLSRAKALVARRKRRDGPHWQYEHEVVAFTPDKDIAVGGNAFVAFNPTAAAEARERKARAAKEAERVRRGLPPPPGTAVHSRVSFAVPDAANGWR